eukprot:TRINITY_DN63_c3_g1_i1.p1 TRINITY_DN63_c3_g1~~TRINITY_DN63_c3_g1_i1.p1  ORF type:complete len:405 (+),score=75.81 TRINITY_DN63_c3_g1_i1:46-1260(+)
MRRGGSSDTRTVIKWGTVVVMVYCSGYWMGYSHAILPAREQITRKQSGVYEEKKYQHIQRETQVNVKPVIDDEKKEDDIAEQNNDAQYEVLDSRGNHLTVAKHFIDLTYKPTKLQKQHLAGKQLTQSEIEALPMYKNVFSNDLLPCGRKVMICPPWKMESDTLQIPLKHLPRKKATSVDQKYDRRAVNCQKSGIWHKISLDDHKLILRVIEKLLQVKKGDYVFDWGSGCGHKLKFLSDSREVAGLGVDVSEKSVEYSVVNTTKNNHFCRANGVRVDEWIPENYFDHAISFGSVYHVYNRTTFCSVIRSMVRVVKKGGRVYNGWTENAEYRRADIAPCLRDLPVTIDIVEERKAFSHVPVFPLKAQQTIPNTYSLVVTKTEATTPRFWKYVPITCTTHKCDEVSY